MSLSIQVQPTLTRAINPLIAEVRYMNSRVFDLGRILHLLGGTKKLILVYLRYSITSSENDKTKP